MRLVTHSVRANRSCYAFYAVDAPSLAFTGISRDTLGHHEKLAIHRMSDAAQSADLLTQSETRWSILPLVCMVNSALLVILANAILSAEPETDSDRQTAHLLSWAATGAGSLRSLSAFLKTSTQAFGRVAARSSTSSATIRALSKRVRSTTAK